MKEIEINGEKYVDKESYEKLLEEKRAAINVKSVMADTVNVCGIGTVEYKYGEFVHTKIAIDYLKKAMAIIETIGKESIDIVFAEDHPLGLGQFDRDNNSLSGVIIAPRVSN